MKILMLIPLLATSLLAYDQKTTLGLEERGYNKYNNEIVATGKSELSFKNDYFNTNIGLEYLFSSESEERRYFLFNELYVSKEFDDYAFNFGKQIKYWGELEGYNVADIYNQKNYLKDPFDKDAKLGTIGADVVRYFGDNSVEVGLKLYEQYIRYPQDEAPYAPFSVSYDEELSVTGNRYVPTYYLKMSFLSDESIDSETSLIFLNGYDTKRYVKPTLERKLKQQAYKVNKALFLSHIIYEDMIFKTEMSYTDVIEDKMMSDYGQLSFGLEKSFYNILGSDVTFYGEYYKYIYDDLFVKNVDISELYDNDVFTAIRINFNDVRSTDIKVGLLQDLEKDENIIKAEINSRVEGDLVIYGEYLHTTSDDETETLLTKFNESSRITVGLEYTF